MTRFLAKYWLLPARMCLAQLKVPFEADTIDGRVVQQLEDGDYAFVDDSLSRAAEVFARLCPDVHLAGFENVISRLAAGRGLTVSQIDAALHDLRDLENALVKLPIQKVRDADLYARLEIVMEDSAA